MHEYRASVFWKRAGDFRRGRYSRGHVWQFDGGVHVPASAAPSSIAPPLSVVEAVDPEEALVAAASSCHMLFFLYLASQRGLEVESYHDEAVGYLGRDADGREAVTRIELRPKIRFGASSPDEDLLDLLHHEAHERCYIANSLRSEILVLASG